MAAEIIKTKQDISGRWRYYVDSDDGEVKVLKFDREKMKRDVLAVYEEKQKNVKQKELNWLKKRKEDLERKLEEQQEEKTKVEQDIVNKEKDIEDKKKVVGNVGTDSK